MSQRPMRTETAVDWVGLAVRLFFGAVLGAIFGAALWWLWMSDLAPAWIVIAIAICAATFGSISAIWGDAFWESDWNPLRWIHWF